MYSINCLVKVPTFRNSIPFFMFSTQFWSFCPWVYDLVLVVRMYLWYFFFFFLALAALNIHESYLCLVLDTYTSTLFFYLFLFVKKVMIEILLYIANLQYLKPPTWPYVSYTNNVLCHTSISFVLYYDTVFLFIYFDHQIFLKVKY